MTNGKKMTRNEKLRHDRLTFYKDDIEQIDKLLAEFLRLSGAKCALLIDKEGHLVTKRGEQRTIDIDTISALVAGSSRRWRAISANRSSSLRTASPT